MNIGCPRIVELRPFDGNAILVLEDAHGEKSTLVLALSGVDEACWDFLHRLERGW